MKITVLYKKVLTSINKIKIILLSLLFFVPKVNGEAFIYSRIVSPNDLSYQCIKQKDDFAVKVLKLLENSVPPDPLLYYKLDLIGIMRNPRPANVDCVAVLDEQYKHLQNLAKYQGGFSDILLWKYAAYYLDELYYYAPFDKKGQLVPLIQANVDKDKPIYPFLLEEFRNR